MPLALGLVETKGLIGAIVAADAMAKAANVVLIGRETINPALVTIKIMGETAAVKHAVECGAQAARLIGDVVSVHIIPHPDSQIEKIIPQLSPEIDNPSPAPSDHAGEQSDPDDIPTETKEYLPDNLASELVPAEESLVEEDVLSISPHVTPDISVPELSVPEIIEDNDLYGKVDSDSIPETQSDEIPVSDNQDLSAKSIDAVSEIIEPEIIETTVQPETDLEEQSPVEYKPDATTNLVVKENTFSAKTEHQDVVEESPDDETKLPPTDTLVQERKKTGRPKKMIQQPESLFDFIEDETFSPISDLKDTEAIEEENDVLIQSETVDKSEITEKEISIDIESKDETITEIAVPVPDDQIESLGEEIITEQVVEIPESVITEKEIAKEIQVDSQSDFTEKPDSEESEGLSTKNVHELRRLARSVENFPIKGREISKANRTTLLEFFRKLNINE